LARPGEPTPAFSEVARPGPATRAYAPWRGLGCPGSSTALRCSPA